MKSIWRGLFWINWIIIFSFWFLGAHELLLVGVPGALIALGRLAGLVAAYMILIQFFLVGRNPLIEGSFGLDTLTRIHHNYGRIGIVFLILHPLLLVFGYSFLAGREPYLQFMRFLENSEYVFLALLGAFFFLIVAALSIHIVRSKLKYESWYIPHLLVYLAIFLSFPHQLANGGTLLLHDAFYFYWIILYALVLVSHVLFRTLRPAYLFYGHRFFVSRIVRETPSAVSVYIKGEKLDRFSIQPGQFIIVRFFSRNFWFEAHPFSLSKPHISNELRITIRELGDFTRRVKDIPLGTKVLIEGPYGVFTHTEKTLPKILLIAGGIGITPLRALVEEMGALEKDVLLLYGSRASKDIVFKEELDALGDKYCLRVIHVLSEKNEYGLEGGYINEEKINRLAPDLLEREVYLCGPVQMVDGIITVLLRLGVKQENIHYERFSLHG